MKTFEVTILGSMAALPYKGQITSAQIVRYDNCYILVDCGEGTQMNLQKYKIPQSKINIICISHLHGDHVFGLPGLLSSFQHSQRKEPLFIFGPKGIKVYLETIIQVTQQYISFRVNIMEIDLSGKYLIHSLPFLDIYCFPLDHRIETSGFLFVEKYSIHHIRKDVLGKYKFTIEQLKSIKEGKDVVLDDYTMLGNIDLTRRVSLSRSYAYCSDTVYNDNIISYIENVDCLYHEATYLHDLLEKAIERKHSTAKQAAETAKNANAKKLIIGHFSARYNDFGVLQEEARTIFPATFLALEGHSFSV
jgi:ribonuclease Z